MRLLVTGARGQLGRALMRVAPERGHEAAGLDLPAFDITDAAAVRSAVAAVRPGVIVNCAAFTAVDAAETQEDAAFAVNAVAVEHLAGVADEFAARLVHVSTDYVFGGEGTVPLSEDAPTGPRSVYGRSKLAGERAALGARRHLVARTAWLFGEGGNNFVEAIRKQLVGGNRALRVVGDQVGCPTYAADLALALVQLVEFEASGLVHVVNSGFTTWHGFAREIAAQLGIAADVAPITAAELGRPAPRPAFAVMATDRLAALIGKPLPPWQDALRRYLASTAGRGGEPDARRPGDDALQ